MRATGFEPVPLTRMAPKATALTTRPNTLVASTTRNYRLNYSAQHAPGRAAMLQRFLFCLSLDPKLSEFGAKARCARKYDARAGGKSKKNLGLGGQPRV